MTLRLRQAVRAIIVDDDDALLLVRFVFPSGVEAWALPGGGLEADEDHHTGLRRELHEELGLDDVDIGPLAWHREHIIPMTTGHDGQRDHCYLVRRPRFEPHPTIGWDRLRAEFVHEMRWWTLPELVAATDVRFAPRRLAELFAGLLDRGVPTTPIDTGV